MVDTKGKWGVTVISAIQVFWSELQREHPELPDVMIVTGTGRQFKRPKSGSFRAIGWNITETETVTVHHPEVERVDGGTPLPAVDASTVEDVDKGIPEVFIAGERIAQGGLLVAQTLIHEAAHALGHVRGIETTGVGGRYHTRKFAELAEELGLIRPAKADRGMGFSQCVMGAEATEKYKPWYEGFDSLPNLRASLALQQAIVAAKATPAPGAGRAGKRLAVVCQCTPQRRLQVSPRTMETGGIRCTVCDENFESEA